MAFVSKPWWKRLSEERFSGSFSSRAGESSRLASAPPCSSLKSSSGDDSDAARCLFTTTRNIAVQPVVSCSSCGAQYKVEHGEEK